MATMITGADLLAAVRAGDMIKRGDPSGVEGVKYDFRLSGWILKSSLRAPVDASSWSDSERAKLTIEPGEVVFVLTEEELNLPMDVVAQLSPKRKLSHAGVLTLGGFCIDPGYRGRLLLGLYNFSSTPFPLRPGKKLVAATFFRLQGAETGTFPVPDEQMREFPDELVATMQKYQPVAAQALSEAVARMQAEVQNLRDDIRSHSEWYKRFETSLERHDKQIGDLLRGLEAEKEARVAGEDRLAVALGKIEHTLAWLRGAAWVVAGLVGAVVIPLIVMWLWSTFFQRPIA